ncbi:phthalate 4,5-cis-dihydrodiol dehydrogenase [Noviherbaspirillum humi]|uniref:Phthalate 4,5-cis-dihydrodiol dehydrogenase n=1 Tax=Noviherbaspirillum humi TaxID=1688639 RepID=A0A239HYV3_9BURK|nr:Gfo/Idh/MocA family oxidoreductase [Noviherbaspirillum humi]SNS86505.1 phthalate 4,5-cis-dihydrodiol dehydrogenase [Noviherbaspirillum humi]
MQQSNKPIRIGMAGYGAAGRAFVPAFRKHSGFELVAIAEPAVQIRTEIQSELAIPAFPDLATMLAQADLDAVYIATPTELHPEHVALACAAGKHVLVEKPMAKSVAQAKGMVEAAERAGVILLVGHSHSYDLPIQRMKQIIDEGSLGPVAMVHTWCYTDWMYRPRRPDELKTELGGGVTFRQGSHQFDILRLLCGGEAVSVRAKTFDWDPERRGIGAHTAFITFANGAVATAVYNGYGRFSSMDLCFDISEWGFHQPAASRVPAKASSIGASPEDELLAKQRRARHAIPEAAPFQPFFGLTIVSCERGEIRQTPTGLAVHTRDGTEHINLPTDYSPRDLVLQEFCDAIIGKMDALHDGRWGVANLELCEAAALSSDTAKEVPLREQRSICENRENHKFG